MKAQSYNLKYPRNMRSTQHGVPEPATAITVTGFLLSSGPWSLLLFNTYTVRSITTKIKKRITVEIQQKSIFAVHNFQENSQNERFASGQRILFTTKREHKLFDVAARNIAGSITSGVTLSHTRAQYQVFLSFEEYLFWFQNLTFQRA